MLTETDLMLAKAWEVAPGKWDFGLPDDKHKGRSQQMRKMLRKVFVAALYLQRQSYRVIGAKLGISPPTVCRDVKEIHKDWVEQYTSDYHRVVLRELAELEEMESYATQRYHGAKEEAAGVQWFRTRLEIKEKRWKLLGITSGDEIKIMIQSLQSSATRLTAVDVSTVTDATTLTTMFRGLIGS